MPTENRSSNTEQMVSLPLDLVELALAHLPSDSAAGFELRELLYRHPPTSDGFSAGDMADQGAKAFAARDGEVEELRTQLAEGLKLAERVRDSSLGMQRKCLSDLLTHLLCASSSEDPSEPVGSDQGIPGTSFQRLNMLANQGE